jgi:hypothetical protein
MGLRNGEELTSAIAKALRAHLIAPSKTGEEEALSCRDTTVQGWEQLLGPQRTETAAQQGAWWRRFARAQNRRHIPEQLHSCKARSFIDLAAAEFRCAINTATLCICETQCGYCRVFPHLNESS